LPRHARPMTRKLESKEDKIKRRMKPFAVLEHHLSDEFIQFAEKMIFFIREHGISQFQPTPGNRKEWLRFAVLVHDGLKQAQTSIAERILANLALREKAILSVNEHHRLKNAEGKRKSRAEASRLQLEITVMRRMNYYNLTEE